MGELREGRKPADEAEALRRVAALLGGARVLRRPLRDPLDAHELLLRGLPAKALTCLIGNLRVIRGAASLDKVLGMSLRTFQRRRDEPASLLTPEQSGRAWKFAEILAKATAIFGSQEDAERWIERPATGLNQRRPIDLMATPAGVALVEDFLERLEYGVYA
jgi:putative toxin-antitoxin system antitoxin component (TIGR02293 family)